MQDTICPITVAKAAPLIPIAGAPNKPNIKIGSRIKFVKAPPICDAVESIVFPVDCKIFSFIMAIIVPNDKIVQIPR